MASPREKWDSRYETASVEKARAAEVLAQNLYLLPRTGRGLDVASGLGANALLLARAGLHAEAWDLSPVAIGKLREHAQAHGLPLDAEVRDVVARPPAPATRDVIVVSHFLDRDLCPALAAALRPGGLIFYQTFSGPGPGPTNPAFRLAPGELLRLFAGLEPVVYREGESGESGPGFHGQALLVARRG